MLVRDSTGRRRRILSPASYAALTGAPPAHTDHAHSGDINAKAAARCFSWAAPSGKLNDVGANNPINSTQARVIFWTPVESFTLAKIDWWTGTVAGGNYDLELLTGDGLTLLWHKGVTAWPSTGVQVSETVGAGVPVVAGTPYLVLFAGDTVSATWRIPGPTLSAAMFDWQGVAIVAGDAAVTTIPLPGAPYVAPVGAAPNQNSPVLRFRAA